MKRVKCYGRMKAVHVDAQFEKVFQNSDDNSLWDLSSAKEECEKRNCNERENKIIGEENLNTVSSSSPQLFASNSLNKEANNVEEKKNMLPKVKAKRKPKGKRKAPKKGEKQADIEKIAEKENVPNFSLIAEHSLLVEKNADDKKGESSISYPTSKRVCPTSNETSGASNACGEEHCQDQTSEIQLTDHVDCNEDSYFDSPDLHFVNVRSFKKTTIRSSFNNQLLWDNMLHSSQKPESFDAYENSLGIRENALADSLPGSTQASDVNLVEETSGNLLGLEECTVPPELVEKCESNQESALGACAQVPSEPLQIPSDSNLPGLVSGPVSEANVSAENNFDLEKGSPSYSKEKQCEERNIPVPSGEVTFDCGTSNPKTAGFMNSTPVVKERKCRNPFPSPNVSRITQSRLFGSAKSSFGSCAKKFKFVTSTPAGKPFKQRLPHFNLSHISEPEKVNSCLAKSLNHAPSPLCSKNVSNLNKSRSLTVLYDTTKFVKPYKPNQLASIHGMQFASDSNKSRTCMEKVPSQSTEFHNSLSITEKLLELCGQESIVPIASVYDWSLIKIRKIGEGTYGEVFMLSQKKPSVIKIIPLSQDGTNTWLNLESVYSEVKVSHCLSALRKNKFNKTCNFSKVNRVHFVKGSYPSQLIKAWDTFSVAKSTYNIRPDCFQNDQLYVILDLEYGGKDMTCFEMKNASEAESILKQITISLAIAEETHLFEHRDLHLGNILVQRVKKKTISYVLGGKPLSLPSQGLMVTIIDFTLSRVFDAGCVYFHNLADDESLFNQSGDLQFEIYRATRKHLQNQWHDCALYSNVLWLTFLCQKLLEYKYSNPTSIRHLKGLNDIGEFQRGLKLSHSALDSLKLCKLASAVPTNSSVESLQMKKTKFVDRKSLQKSKTNLRN